MEIKPLPSWFIFYQNGGVGINGSFCQMTNPKKITLPNLDE
jgi:hypothetical protein